MTTRQPRISACIFFINSQAADRVPGRATPCTVNASANQIPVPSHCSLKSSPPVASRSSISTTFCPGTTASSWTSASACRRIRRPLKIHLAPEMKGRCGLCSCLTFKTVLLSSVLDLSSVKVVYSDSLVKRLPADRLSYWRSIKDLSIYQDSRRYWAAVAQLKTATGNTNIFKYH